MERRGSDGAVSGAPAGRILAAGCPTSLTGARPRGVAVDFHEDAFKIRLCAEDGSVLLTLGDYAETEVISVWRSLAAVTGLPLLVRGPDGAMQQPYPQLGRLVLGGAPGSRSLCVLSGRRPRFLVRRKASRMPARPVVRREREIVAGSAA